MASQSAHISYHLLFMNIMCKVESTQYSKLSQQCSSSLDFYMRMMLSPGTFLMISNMTQMFNPFVLKGLITVVNQVMFGITGCVSMSSSSWWKIFLDILTNGWIISKKRRQIKFRAPAKSPRASDAFLLKMKTCESVFPWLFSHFKSDFKNSFTDMIYSSNPFSQYATQPFEPFNNDSLTFR